MWGYGQLRTKLFLAGDKILNEIRATNNLRPQAVDWQMVLFFASQEDRLIEQLRWDGIIGTSDKQLEAGAARAKYSLTRLLSHLWPQVQPHQDTQPSSEVNIYFFLITHTVKKNLDIYPT